MNASFRKEIRGKLGTFSYLDVKRLDKQQKRCVLFMEMVPEPRKLSINGLLGSKVKILIWKMERSGKPAIVV